MTMDPLLTGHDVLPDLSLWQHCEDGIVCLINHSENQIFAINAPSGGRYAMRVHRIGYQSRAAIESELHWLVALRRDTDLPVPTPLAGRDGHFLQSFTGADGVQRFAVLFEFIDGVEPSPADDLTALFNTLGRYAAVLHNHAQAWARPRGFERPEWNARTILDAEAPWGDWRQAPGVGPGNRELLERLDRTLRQRLAGYGQSPERFGLIHADMRLGNLLVDGDAVTLIDFDDCGFSWFVYDFAAAISFYETAPNVPTLKSAWIAGYQSVRQLNDADIAAIDTMVMLRRMALLAWIGSHAETGLAQAHTRGFAAGTAQLAERYLAGAL
jgi:Ser/Thr protein kinase RdoA (MazF antagonist)